MNYFKENLKFLRKKSSLSQTDFANKIGVNRPIIGSYEEGRAEPKFETPQNIAHFFQITLDYLLQKNLSKGSELLIKKSDGSDLRILPIVVSKDNEEQIPLVPIKAAAGYMNSFEDIDFIENLPQFSIPVQELSQGTYRAFQIKGDSMLPIQPESYVLAEYLENWNWVKSGESYIIVSKEEGIVYKRAINNLESNHSLELHSDNKEYSPFEIHVNDIQEVWKAKGYLTFNLPDSNTKEDLSVNELSTMLLELKSKVDQLK
ncbi:MAG: LexA family transcriptional regulator [Flavobacteriales bacterium]|nr:LexA family transcriptional regulator [Flavobacteriales bacterium]